MCIESRWVQPKVVPASLRERVLNLNHDPILQGHSWTIRMYCTLRRDFYWPLMFDDNDHYVSKCITCACARGTTVRHQYHLQLFPATVPLQDVAIDLIVPLPKTKNGKRHIMVITNRYSKLTREVSISNSKAPHVAAMFLNHWVFPYGIPNTLLTDNGCLLYTSPSPRDA